MLQADGQFGMGTGYPITNPYILSAFYIANSPLFCIKQIFCRIVNNVSVFIYHFCCTFVFRFVFSNILTLLNNLTGLVLTISHVDLACGGNVLSGIWRVSRLVPLVDTGSNLCLINSFSL